MNFKEFSKIVKSGEISGAYLLSGEEEYIKDLAVKTIIDKYVSPGFKEINFDKVDASSKDVFEIEKAMLQLPFMTEKRVVTVYGLPLLSMTAAQIKQSQNKKTLEDLTNIINRCPGETILLIVDRGQTQSTAKKIFSSIDRNVDFKTPDFSQKIQYLKRMAKEFELKISEAALKTLCEYTGMDLLELDLEIKKLKAYAGNDEITEQEIMSICPPAAEYNVFKMLKLITNGEGSKALAEYRNLIFSGQSPQAVIAMIERQFRGLFYISDINIANPMELKSAAAKLGTKDFVIKNMQRMARRISQEKIGEISKWCADADFMVKSGKVSIESSAEMLIMKLIGI